MTAKRRGAMTPLNRNEAGCAWPKPILDFAAASEIKRANHDVLMDALDALLGGCGVSVRIQDVPVQEEYQITQNEIVFEARVSQRQLEQGTTLKREWYNEVWRIAPHCIYFVQLDVHLAQLAGDQR
jgi:hypothetical protein